MVFESWLDLAIKGIEALGVVAIFGTVFYVAAHLIVKVKESFE